MKSDFQYRCLIVEDDDGWYPYLKDSLSELLGARAVIETAQDVGAAKKKLRRHYFHGVSFDLGMPGGDDDEYPDASKGANLFNSAFLPVSAEFIFSAYLSSDAGEYAREVATRRSSASLTKSLSGISNFSYIPRLSAQDWADFVAARLRGPRPDFCSREDAAKHWICRDWGRDPRAMPYLASYWRDAGKFLPPPLALFAKDLAEPLSHLDDQGDPQLLDMRALHNLNQFREWTLQLLWTQCVVLLRRAGKAIDTRLLADSARTSNPTDPIIRKYKDLQVWRSEEAVRAAPALRSHWHWDEEDRLDILAASDRLRDWRNKAAHGRPKENYAGDWPQIQAAVLTLMDAAATWAHHWLYAEPRTEQGRWQGARLTGAALPWSRHDLGDLNHHPAGERNSVFQKLWVQKEEKLGAILLDWYPWLLMAADEETGQSVPWLVTHPVEGSGSAPRWWYTVCLTNLAKVKRREFSLQALFG